jgi:polysaccharide export outer membrane protein
MITSQRATVTLLLAASLSLGGLPAAGQKPRNAKEKPATSVAGGSTAGLASAPEDYRIGVDDILQITVWKEPEASVPTIAVRPDGKISLPFVKEVVAAGRTPLELEADLTAKFKPFLRGAEVTVLVREIRSKKVYIIGAVGKPGAIGWNSSLTVLQALAEGGGITEYAKKKKIYILRKAGGRQVRLTFNYEAVIKGEKMEQNITLLPEDTIVVPQ